MPSISTFILLALAVFLIVRENFFRKRRQESYSVTGAPGKKKSLEAKAPIVRFADVAGAENAKQELQDIIDYMKNPEKYQRLGATIPRGVLLAGPPGTGKTLLSRAVAGESGVAFLHTSGSQFVEKYVGVGARRIRDLFKEAKAKAPAIIFIDELDSIARQRGSYGISHEHDQALNQLLVEMDGFDSKLKPVVVIGATNRIDVLDAALLRPGRFDRHIFVDPPDHKGRLMILEIHTKNKPLSDDVNLEAIAKMTVGLSGADLANICNEAALLAAREGAGEITYNHLLQGMDRTLAGIAHANKPLSDREREIAAYHEVGHAVATALLGFERVQKISIIPQGRALGYVIKTPGRDQRIRTQNELEAQLQMLLAGRAAEKLIFGDVSTGAEDDFQQASRIAFSMVTRWGMSPMGPLHLSNAQPTAGETSLVLDHAKKILEAQQEKVEKLLAENIELLRHVTGILLEREVIEGDEFYQIIKQYICQKK